MRARAGWPTCLSPSLLLLSPLLEAGAVLQVRQRALRQGPLQATRHQQVEVQARGMQGQPGVRARPQQIRLQGGQLPRQLPLPARKPEILTLRQVPLKCLSEPKAPPKWRQAAKKLKDCEACEGESPLKTPAARLPKGRTVLSSFVFAELLLSRASPVDM